MVENVWNKVFFILATAVLSVILFTSYGVRQGLDLQGGSRLVYKLDIADAIKKGDVDAGTSYKDVVDEVIGILQKRIDPTGALEASIMPQGSDRLLIEIPGRTQAEVSSVRSRIQQLGKLQWILVVDSSQDDYDLAAEKDRLKAWLDKPINQATIGRSPLDINVFNSLPPDAGGPVKGKDIMWIPMFKDADPMPSLEFSQEIEWTDPAGKKQKTTARFIPVNTVEESFSGEDLGGGSIKQTQDDVGAPAVAFELRQSRRAAFADFTEKHKKRPFAIVLNEYCRTAPTIRSRIPGRGIITLGGGTSPTEVRDLIHTLRTGSLKLKPELESESTLGPTVGEQAIQTGTLSMILGGALVLAFMVLFYRKAGIIALISLSLNVVLLIGAMAAFRFTLTLPGLAGLVLTMGMAVDANILIFERIREELDKGKVLLQAVKNGFDMAFSTIIDANLTTLITALILYSVGEGPIKGFAITLSIGIITSVFAALVISKVVFHLGLEKKILQTLTMGRVFKNPAYPFLAIRKPFNVLSVLVIVASVAIFATTKRDTKLGIDFTGGASMRISLAQEHPIDEVREAIIGEIPSAQVMTLGAMGNRGNEFAVKFKTPSGELKENTAELAQQYRGELRKALGKWLLADPYSNIDITPSPEKNFNYVNFHLHTSKPVKVADLQQALSGYAGLTIKPVDEAADKGKEAIKDFNILMNMDAGIRPSDLPERLAPRLSEVKDIEGGPIALTDPFPEFESIGARVVGELQTKAIMAILLSLFAVVMYIRVRFHEYKYGIAAVIALVHDVVIALGMVVFCNSIGLVNAEIDLPMIAAFLTIIGYSLNDTIVVFDRIRENLPRLTGTYTEILNQSINQTLARTVWTSATTFMVLLAIFVLNYGQRNVLEGFSFAMLIGIIVGTYSSIFVASPALIMLHSREEQAKAMTPKEAK